MIQYSLVKRSPGFLRWYRARLLLDFPRLLQSIPHEGRLLDVGCGVGSVDWEIAKERPGLNILGIDLDPTSITLAREHNNKPNIAYEEMPLEAVQGHFACVLFIDVFHHVPPEQHDGLLLAAAKLLDDDGYVFIKDVERRRGQISRLMDCYLSGSQEVWLLNCDEMRSVVGRHLSVDNASARFRFPFPHYYIRAVNQK